MLTSWLPMLGPPLDELVRLPVETLCRRIAAHQYSQALDAARSCYHTADKKARSTELHRLAASKLLTERVAADLVRRWDVHR